MVDKLITKSKRIFTAPQTSILSAATIIMVMVVASRVLGLVRQRILASFFAPSDLSLFFAAFRLPDLIFEILVFGTVSSAFIPVFTKYLNKSRDEAWKVAGRAVNIGLLIFAFFSISFSLLATQIYTVVAPGFSVAETAKIALLARILFAAQGFFVISYILTGVLESLRRFLIPALAPVFYNLGIILGTLFLAPKFGLIAPAIGVVAGASLHFLIQLPLAYKLGFRFVASIRPTKGVKKIGRLALPRIVGLSFQQVAKTAELFLASLISTASYTYLTFANSLQLLPVSLFGISLAKAALPTLARQEGSPEEFRKTLLTTFYQIIFLVLPLSTILIVLRVPIVRLVFGTDIFDWEATLQTGMALTAFGVGVPFQAAAALLSRGFFAIHDTKTPVYVSLLGIVLTITTSAAMVLGLGLPVWSLAAAFSFGVGVQAIVLFVALIKRIDGISVFTAASPISKSLVSSFVSGLAMFFLLKFFDRSVWVKRLSILSHFRVPETIPFEKFVIDTRYTGNLLILTAAVSLVGILIYIGTSLVLKSRELAAIVRIVKSRRFAGLPKEQEPLTSPPSETSN